MRIKTFIVIIFTATMILGAMGTAVGGKVDISPFIKEINSNPPQDRARLLGWKRELVDAEFPQTREQAMDILAKTYPGKSEDRLAALLDDPAVTYIEINGERRYFDQFLKNIWFRTPTLFWEQTKGKRPFFDSLENIVFPVPGSGYPSKWIKPYINPVDYQGNITIAIPRKKLPEAGVVEIWVPLPISTSSQKWPRLLALFPEKFVTTVPRLDGDIGYVHFAFPMQELEGDLKISVDFSFSHYQQRFIVDPEKVLPYDKSSPEYRHYTRSYGNTTFTPEMTAAARQITEGETNPYLAAQRIYTYIVDTIPYSFVPHLTVQILGIPESVYVYKHGHGDCGAQSMYFSALCRSLGIPARSTGGYQAVPGYEGTHFWAEFYVEGYGWLPVDTTVAETVDWTAEVTREQRRTFKKFFFGNLDPYRFVIQKDVDTILNPVPQESMLTDNMPLLVLQSPAIVCTTCDQNPFITIDEHTSVTYYPVDR